jgi:hypothetical protein
MSFVGTYPSSTTYPGTTLYPGDAVPDAPVFDLGQGDGGNVDETTIRIQTLGARWETLGVDRLAGIVAEGIEASANEWGPDTLSFSLKAEADARRPDIAPYTPLELEVGGQLCWSGFVWQRPSDANGYTVGCRGWQYALDDPLFDRRYVHTRLSDFVDIRSLLSADLFAATSAGSINVDGGVISLGWPIGAVLANGTHVGVTFDAGADSSFIRAILTAETSFNGSFYLYLIGHDEPYWGPGVGRLDYIASQAINAAPWTAASQSQTFAASIASGKRYTTVFLYSNASATLAADVWLKIRSLQLFRTASYESGNASVLKADAVIKDALTFAPALNQDTTLIAPGTFNIPSYETGGFLSPRQVMEAANAYENYRLKIGGPDLKTLVFDPKPVAPIIEVGEWSGAQFADATVSGEPIYNLAVIDATGPDSGRIRVFRGSGIATGELQQITGFTLPLTNASPSAPGNINTTSERDGSTSSTFPNFKQGVPYTIIITSATTGASGNTSGAPTTWRVRLGDFGYGTGTSNPARASAARFVQFDFIINAGGTAGPFYATYVPDRDHTWLEGEILQVAGNVTNGALTSFAHGSYRGTTMLDRRGIVRAIVLPINSAITQAVGERFGDLWLADHATSPFAGSLTLQGSSARRLLGGSGVRAHECLLFGGEQVRFSNRVDPDTGGWGRDGRIAGVTYRHDARQVEIAIDDRRDNFERILSRYGVLVDQFS